MLEDEIINHVLDLESLGYISDDGDINLTTFESE